MTSLATHRRFRYSSALSSLAVQVPTVAEKLTVLIPCKDERRNIRACIESVQTIADEVLVADSGSTDGTLDIVRDMGGCRILEREYINSANFKNWAIPQAQHEWVLVLDADERITPELAEEIRGTLESPSPNIDGYWIDRANHYLGYRIKHCGWNSDAVIRLFRRECRYETRWVHAEVDLPSSRLDSLRRPMLHYTTWDSDLYLYKMNRYAGWGALNLRDAGKRPSFLAMITRAPLRFFQLYVLRLGFLDGIPGFQICMHTAYYAFLKQAKLWELYSAIPQPDPEAERNTGFEVEPILAFPKEAPPQTRTNNDAKTSRRVA
ncbi:MAG: glycosyltransferase family 2 protein [Pirellulales bacterium]|nr:glycosyltransferase family 2 protein [Pirellulales bacterium]